MSKPLQPRPHGVIDYTVGILLVLAPMLFGFSDDSTVATNTMRLVGWVAIGLSLITNYPLGLVKVVPFRIHGILESLGAMVLLVSPWLFGYNDIGIATTLAVLVGVAWLIVVAMTNYVSQVHRPVR